MTQRDYMLIAEALRMSDAPKSVVDKIAEYLGRQNPRFNAMRFSRAAGVEGA